MNIQVAVVCAALAIVTITPEAHAEEQRITRGTIAVPADAVVWTWGRRTGRRTPPNMRRPVRTPKPVTLVKA